MEDESTEELVERARRGESAALEALVALIRDDVYGLAMRMLWHPEDAEDATQEILIKVIVHLDTFRGEAAFRTWVYRVAANHLLTTRRRRMERAELTFTTFGADLYDGLDLAASDTDPAQELLAQEVKIGCTQAMLQCLDREHRLAYILGEVFAIHSRDAAQISGTSPAAYRKRLERARSRISDFMQQHCGLVNEKTPCRCHRRVAPAIRQGRVNPNRMLFAAHLHHAAAPSAETREMQELHDVATIFRSHPHYTAPERISRAVSRILQRPLKILAEES